MSKLKNGIYRSENALYIVKAKKIIMHLSGSTYKTSESFMLGAKFVEPLTDKMKRKFDKYYSQLKQW
ncbi:MAG: hypothetical protein Unbinned2819contig1004_16 [Prokaryotic dsDNA virus sp.]|nr:MAG: hypothetical protein Unbinned2819contig1004_16 [Prokaryotic dsDNA virus sp.]|tara:strand:+ start:716 stop:916 length:201 start_codon:yes stop_codon:yes gene_type:complete